MRRKKPTMVISKNNAALLHMLCEEYIRGMTEAIEDGEISGPEDIASAFESIAMYHPLYERFCRYLDVLPVVGVKS